MYLFEDLSVIEVGPRLSFQSAFSSNATTICHACGLDRIVRVEKSRRYLIITQGNRSLTKEEHQNISGLLFDRMTEEVYPVPLQTFEQGKAGSRIVNYVPIMREGKHALEKINHELGLAFDDWDLEYYTRLFRDDLKRDPTDVECFDMAQSNSEHSRYLSINPFTIKHILYSNQHSFFLFIKPLVLRGQIYH